VNSVWILIAAFVWFIAGYVLYGRRLARVYGVDPDRPTPAREKEDGVDYVPARNWMVLFGHHFSSICGAGPIIGPALAVAYWGWAPSVAWVFLGAVLMGAVADFTSLFVSVRSDGHTIAEIARPEISPRARLLFSWFIWVALVLVIAVFAIFAARTFLQEPHAVIPSLALIPVALLVGHLLYRTNVNTTATTAIGLALLGMSLFVGTQVPVAMPPVLGMSPETVWIVILLGYCFVASIAPVQVLLQPRDYLASFLLFGAIGIGVAGVFITSPEMQARAFNGFDPPAWPAAGPMWPMLFVTIACGAISGFHSLVSSGTTCKQLDNEAHACRVGYGGMILEGLVGILVIICVGSSLGIVELEGILGPTGPGPITAFSTGYGRITEPILGSHGSTFAVMALNAFILTTLDTGTRIGRYLTGELVGNSNMYVSTALVTGVGCALALTGQWTVLWPAFGTSNQLIAALALLVGSCWMMRRGRSAAYTFIPACIMLATTLAAFLYQLHGAINHIDPVTKLPSPNWFLAALVVVLIALAAVVFWEGVSVLLRQRARTDTPAGQRA
jgi:carbon starvation protein